jgi:hypothetical protein
MREETATITHEFGTNEFFESSGFDDKTHWMIFKVKQKARKNYFDKVSTSRSGTELKTLEQNPEVSIDSIRGGSAPVVKIGNESIAEISYNWPYDYFSTIEMCSVNASVDFGEASVPLTTTTATSAVGLETADDNLSETGAVIRSGFATLANLK